MMSCMVASIIFQTKDTSFNNTMNCSPTKVPVYEENMILTNSSNFPIKIQLLSDKMTNHIRSESVPQIRCPSRWLLTCPKRLDCNLKMNGSRDPINWSWECKSPGQKKTPLWGRIYFESCYGNKDMSCINVESYHFRPIGSLPPPPKGSYEWNNAYWKGTSCYNSSNLVKTDCGCPICKCEHLSCMSKYNKNKSKEFRYKNLSMIENIIEYIIGFCVSCLFGLISIGVVFLLSELLSEMGGFGAGIIAGGLAVALLNGGDDEDSYNEYFQECDD